jgi:hypothetical protein
MYILSTYHNHMQTTSSYKASQEHIRDLIIKILDHREKTYYTNVAYYENGSIL